MTPEQANECATKLFALFPTLGPEQVKDWAYEFEKHEVSDVMGSMADAHRENGDGFLRGKDLTAGIRAFERRRKMEQDARRRADQDQEDRERVARIDQAIAEMADGELAIRKAEVLAQLPDGRAKALLKDRDPRRSAWLKGLIYERMKDERLAEVL